MRKGIDVLTRLLLFAMLIALPATCGAGPWNEKNDAYRNKMASMSYNEVIRYIKTPFEVQRYLLEYLKFVDDTDGYGERDYIASFKVVHERGGDDCDGAAVAAAALLHDNGYAPLMLCMYKIEHDGENIGGHGIYIYRVGDEWGTLGIKGYDCRFPRYNDIEEIVRDYSYEKYNVKNIAAEYPDWLNSSKNMKGLYDPLHTTHIEQSPFDECE